VSVCPLLRVCCCGPGGHEISIECCTAGAQQQRRAAGECRQCHLVSIDLFISKLLYISSNNVYGQWWAKLIPADFDPVDKNKKKKKRGAEHYSQSRTSAGGRAK